MAYRGYFDFVGEELANTARVLDHIRGLSAADDAALQAQLPGGCRPFEIGYDDSWSGWHAAMGMAGPYTIGTAPWMYAFGDTPISRQFLGIWVMDVQGLDTSTFSAAVTENLGDGGTAGYGRAASRSVRFTALVIGTTDAGAQLGMRWLHHVLGRASTTDWGGSLGMRFYPATPEGSGMSTAEFDSSICSLFLPSVTQMPEIVDVSGIGGGAQHRQSTIRRVEFTITFQDPTIYADNSPHFMELTKSTGPVQWIQEGECFDSEECKAHIVYPESCGGNTPTLVGASPVMPACAGCVPLCDLSTWVGPVDLDPGTRHDVFTFGVVVTNMSEIRQSGTFYFRQNPGSPVYDPRCNRFGAGAINDLEPGDSVFVAPHSRGVTIIPFGMNPRRSVGFLTAHTGAPYRLPTIARPGDGGGIELVVEGAPSANWEIVVTRHRRVL